MRLSACRNEKHRYKVKHACMRNRLVAFVEDKHTQAQRDCPFEGIAIRTVSMGFILYSSGSSTYVDDEGLAM